MTRTVLQLLPRTPGSFDGVGDYALNLARFLSAQDGIRSVFAVREHTPERGPEQLEVLPMDDDCVAAAKSAGKFDGVILHYANYGYQKRGIPTWLPRFITRLRYAMTGRLITVFHELYASGSPWGSAFWLQPLQKRIATQISTLSDGCIVSNEVTAEQLRALNPVASIT
ncbi:MAG: glycosyltransferase family 1 protein, partial [Chthoniobacterales bacterium]